jgi:non-heme chloroperoxidase
MRVRSAALSTGVTLPYVEHGAEAGAPLLLVHGVGDSWRSFTLLLPHLPPAVRAIAPTLRGHGDADKPEAGYQMADFAADVAAFMDGLGLETAVLAGHSLGSAVMHRLAYEQPQRVSGLVLISPRPGTRAGLRAFWDSTISRLADPLDPAFVRGMVIGWSAARHPLPEPFVEAQVADGLKMPARVWQAIFASALAEDFVWMRQPLAPPALLLWGEADESVTESDRATLARTFPGAQRIDYPGAGHSPHWELPAQVAADLAAFIAGLPGHDTPRSNKL